MTARAPHAAKLTAPLLLAALCAIGLSLAPSTASAQSMYLGVGIGPAIRLDDWPNQFRIEEEIGWYFGDGPRGFYLGFSPSQSFGAGFWVLVFPLRLGGMFDIFHNSDVTFQLGPTGSLGVAASNTFDVPGRDADAWFHLSFAFMLRLLVADERVALYVQPVGLEFAIGDSFYFGNEAIRYVLVGGAQFYL